MSCITPSWRIRGYEVTSHTNGKRSGVVEKKPINENASIGGQKKTIIKSEHRYSRVRYHLRNPSNNTVQSDMTNSRSSAV